MSWIPTLNAWQWAILGAVPLLIVLMYFLKLRREPVEVPSTYLWSRTIEDLHVNSLLQRLRRSILLLLQLLAVLLATLALLRPGVRGESSVQSRLVFMIDTSASMQATDVAPDANRFEQARRLIAERIEAMQDSETAMLVSFNTTASVLQSFTSDRRRLREALDQCEVTDKTTDVVAALRAADGLAGVRSSSDLGPTDDPQPTTGEKASADDEAVRPKVAPADLLLYSDGGFPSADDLELENLAPQYIGIGSATPNNLAVTAFSAERNPERPSELQTYATVSNLGSKRATATATLSIADNFIDAASIDLEPGEQTGVSFKLENDDAVEMKLTLDVEDDLVIDNRAFAGLAPPRSVQVLVATPGNKPLELALSTLKSSKLCNVELVPPTYLESSEYEQRAVTARDDLMIFDRCSPKVMPTTNTFFIGSLPTSGWDWDSPPQSLVLIDVDRTHPLLRYIELLSLLVYEGRSVKGPAGTTELVGADIGSVLALAPRDGFLDLVLGFEVVSESESGAMEINTNWYAERSWPVFVFNVLKFLAGAADASAAESYQPGETIRLRIDTPEKTLRITRNNESPEEVPIGAGGVTEFTETDEVGNYRVETGDKVAGLFTINLFDRRESTLAAAEQVTLGYRTVGATSSVSQQRQEYWRWLLLAMLGILVVEWCVYARRVA